MKHTTNTNNKGGKLFLMIFGLPFFCVGVFMLYKSTMQITDWLAMDSYERVPARISSLYVDTSAGDDGDTYQLKGSFEYQFNSRIYRSDTITQYDSYDNIGDYHHDTLKKINSSKDYQGEVLAFVSASDPSKAYLDNTFRWALFGFHFIFIIVFGGFGTAMVFSGYLFKGDDDPSKPEYAAAPWRARSAWKDEGALYSDGKMKVYIFAGFALFWNAISSFVPFAIYDEAINGNNNVVWVAAIFPLIGIGLFFVALRAFLNWRKFGKCPMVLSPFPGELGGSVKGYIDVNVPFDGSIEYKVALKNQYHYVTRSSNNRSSSSTNDIWTAYAVAKSEGSLAGTRIYFDFTTPEAGTEHTRETDIKNGGTYYGWILHFKADFPGKLDFDRSYDIPVFKKR